MNIGHSDLVPCMIIANGLVVNNCHTKSRCAQYCTNVPPKTEKSAQNVHLMTPSSANIGQTDLLFSAQIEVNQRSDYHHRPLGCDQKCANVPPNFTKNTKNRQKCALDDPRSP